MSLLCIPHPYKEDITINFGQFTQIIGSNHDSISYILQLLNWYFGGKKYTEFDLSLFNQKEPILSFEDGSALARSAFQFISITSPIDLAEQVTYKKGAIAFDFVRTCFRNIDIATELEVINNQLSKISHLLNQANELKTQHTTYHITEIDFTAEQLISKSFLPTYEFYNHQVSFDLLSVHEKYMFFLTLLEQKLLSDPSNILLSFYHTDSQLNTSDYQEFSDKLLTLVKAFPHLSVIVFHSNSHNLTLDSSVVPYINIISQENICLDSLDFLYSRYVSHYPTNNVPDFEEFTLSIKQIGDLLFSDRINKSLSIRDLVALKIIHNLYHFPNPKLDFTLPNQLEIHYLQDNP